MFRELQNAPVLSWTVFRPLHGASIGEGPPLELGPFTIYDWDVHRVELEERFAKVGAFPFTMVNPDPSNTVISVDMSARDSDKASEYADQLFEKFEATVRFMLGQDDSKDVGIFDSLDQVHLRSLAIAAATGAMSTDFHYSGPVHAVNLRKPYYSGPEYGHDRIWAMLESGQAIKGDYLASRILRAVVWIGKILKDHDPERKIVQLLFALESLYSSKEHDVPIADRLAEYAAFVLEDGYDGRADCASRVKALYGKRSAIAHGGSSEISAEDLADALRIARGSVIALLTKPELAGLNAYKQLTEWAKKMRYS